MLLLLNMVMLVTMMPPPPPTVMMVMVTVMTTVMMTMLAMIMTSTYLSLSKILPHHPHPLASARAHACVHKRLGTHEHRHMQTWMRRIAHSR